MLVVSPVIVSAAQVSLQWDANDPAPEGYRVYQRFAGQSYDYSVAVWTGTQTSCTIDNLSEDVTYYFVVRAFGGEDSRGDSNEVTFSSEEFLDGKDPSSNQDNQAPDAPSVNAPTHGATSSTIPEINLSTYLDHDEDVHLGTQYQISTDADFTQIVFDRTSTIYLTVLTILDLILDPDTAYYLRARFIDVRNGVSEWSETRLFYTSDYSSNGDSNANGVLDEQEIETHSDIDGDGTNDQVQAGIIAMNAPDNVNPQMAVKKQNNKVQVVAARGYPSNGLGWASSLPATMTGLVCFKLYLEGGNTAASVTIHLSKTAPADGTWYQYDIEQGWYPYPNATLSDDRQTIMLMLEDGGMGDQDGVRNGVIVDPAGLAYSSRQNGESSAPSNETTGNGGCFIGACRGEHLNSPIPKIGT